MPDGAEDGIVRGMYLVRSASDNSSRLKVQLLGSGAMLREVLAAADLLRDDFGVEADVWSVTSFKSCAVRRWTARDGICSIPRRRHESRMLRSVLSSRGGTSAVASTDYMRHSPIKSVRLSPVPTSSSDRRVWSFRQP